MSLLSSIHFALKQCWREWKAGELTVLLMALIIAISSHTAIGFFTDRVDKAMSYRARDLVGGDLILKSARPIPSAWLSEARDQSLKVALTQQFSSIVMHGDNMLLVSVKAVDAAYPLKAPLKTSQVLYGDSQLTRSGPKLNEVWVEAGVLSRLDMKVGETLTLGVIDLKVARVITLEPDRGGSMYSFTPRVMLNVGDLARTEVVQSGSRIAYKALFVGEDENIRLFENWLKPNLSPSHHLTVAGEQSPVVGNALGRAKQFMGLASLIAVLLAAVAIASSGKHYSERHFDTSAMLRCFGCSQNDILFIYLFQLLLLALIGSISGIALGWLAQYVLLYLLKDLLPAVIPAADWRVAWSGLGLGCVVLLGFTLPSVIRLRRISPLRVLRKDLEPLPLSAWTVYGSAILLVILLMWFYTGSLPMTLSVLAGAGLVWLLTGTFIKVIFYLLEKSAASLSFSVRAGTRNLLRRKQDALAQTAAFGLTLMAMLVVLFVRTDLLENWKKSLPDDVPNHFVINILPDQVASFSAFLEQRHIKDNALYPMSRGRLTRINDLPVQKVVSKDARGSDGLNRELNLTWSDTLQADNKILSGEWWAENEKPDKPEVSVESRLAKRLGIKMGDSLTFFTGQNEWQAEVKSIRSVQWESFRPNFYFVFDPRSVTHLPATYMTSFYLPAEKKVLLTEVVKTFPAISVFEMDAMLMQLKGIITQVIAAIEYVLFFNLAAGLVVTLSTLNASLEERLREGALMRTLGASGKFIRRSHWSEFGLMGLTAGVVALVGAELVRALSSIYLFQMSYTPIWWAWFVVPLSASFGIAVLGVYSSRKVLTQSPAIVLRDL